MSLPIDIGSSLWFMPTALWEWEPDPAQAPCGTSQDAAPDAALPSGSAGDESPPMKLVFKGFVNTADFHWYFADSASSRAWVREEVDDEHRRHDVPPVPHPDPAADPTVRTRDDEPPVR